MNIVRTTNAVCKPSAAAGEIGGPQDLVLRVRVNRQNDSTENMISGADYLVWYLGQFMTLYPGDVVKPGTPAGAAPGRPGKLCLCDGDVTELEIDGLGR
jgi:2-keto-4-pentenoate hydratase/2-oxohepta-3-ene-1,7-dioic acid hydratase in catechol pathway